MRGKFGFAVVLLAAAAWLATESTSYAGRGHRRARCGGCYSACNTGCGSYSGCGQSAGCGDCTAPAANADASPSDGAAPPPPPAPDQGAQAEPAPAAPAVQAGTTASTANTYYYGNRRARRGWFRR